ncbi:MAG TPA: TonB family protein [Candidatus Rifleibacterium sp.]|nr:TonB family protein [Candidatus Rifleibacterium sp.]
MTVFGAEEQRVERLTTFVSLFLALLLQLAAGLLLVGMCREEVLTRQPPVPLITVNLAPEPAPAGPAKIAAPAPVEETEKVSNVSEISQPVPPVEEPQPVLPQPQPEPKKVTPEPEVIPSPEAAPIEPPALQKTEELKKPEPPKKPRISKKAELKSVKPDKKTIEKAIEKPVLKPVEKLMPQPEPVKASAEPEPLLSTQPTAPALPESVTPVLNAAAQADRSAVSQTEKPVKALSGEEQKAIARYLAQIRKSLDRSRVYPPEARKKRIEGIVPVKFRISADGLVVGTEVTGNAPGILAEAVIQMLAGRRFPPPPTGWQPSAAIELNINFNLR